MNTNNKGIKRSARGLVLFICASHSGLAMSSERKLSTVCDNSPVGTCIENFKYNPEEPSENKDESVSKIEEMKDKSGARYVWFWDGTPSANPDRILYQWKKNNDACVILFAPSADEVKFKLTFSVSFAYADNSKKPGAKWCSDCY